MILSPIRTVLKNRNISNQDFTRLKKAERSGEELLRLVNEILDISKLETDELKLEEQSISLYHWINRIYSSFESQALYNGIEFLLDYQPDDYLNIKIDARKFEAIITNLLSNALKFTPKSGQIILAVQASTNIIKITVSDTGIGIHTDDLPHIFNRFYQSKNQRYNQSGGTGIGLAICQEYAKLMNGKLWVESPITESQTGSRFIFECPKIVVAHIPDLSIVEKEEAFKQLPLTPISDYQLLVVEDNAHLRQYLQEILSPHYPLSLVSNGQEAIEAIKTTKPALIISDVLMPVMNGFELLEYLKSNETLQNIPVIMLTALIESKDKLKALRIGVDDYLTKPFDEEELLVRIENLLNNYTERIAYNVEPFQEKPLTASAIEEKLWLEELEKVVLTALPNFNLTVDVLAQEMNMSRTSFFSKIKKLTGLSPNQYLQEARLVKARKMLENKSVTSVKDVAYKVGIKNVKYFSQLFKKRFSTLPSEFLK